MTTGRHCKDHPRVCGEKAGFCGVTVIETGSPPRVRGKVAAAFSLLRLERITPACAGKSITDGASGSQGTDHPRVCGEKLFALFFLVVS